MTFKALIDDTLNFLFRSNLRSTEEPTASNIHLESFGGGGLYPFIKTLPFRDKQSKSLLGTYYKPPQVVREDKGVGNMPHDGNPWKNLG